MDREVISLYKLDVKKDKIGLEDTVILKAIRDGEIPIEELFRRGKNSITRSIKISRTLEEALNELVIKLRPYGIKSINDLITKLLAGLVISITEPEINNNNQLIININFNNINQNKSREIIYKEEGGNTTRNTTRNTLPSELRDLIRRSAKTLKVIDNIRSESEKIRILEDLLDGLLKYRGYTIAEYYIQLIRAKLDGLLAYIQNT